MAKKRPELPAPTVPPCMLFCDSVILEQGTGKTTLVGTEHHARFRGKLFVEQLHFVWHQFQFPHPGEYAFQLWSQGRCLAERRLTVRRKGGTP